ncbi:MAG: asparagine synthase [Sandaracinaceae bacterium]|nr:asparagine synthase [Sandaracinaceae bacterium]
MSLLAGYMGAPDPRVDAALVSALRLRHQGAVHHVDNAHGRLFWAADAFTPDEAARGLARCGAVALGIAGERIPTPAELLASYLTEGVSAFDALTGAFVLAVLDGRQLVLARDTAGERSLYVTRHASRRCFAIEPKALWGLPGFSREIEPSAVPRYFTFSFQPGRETMLRGIHQVPAAGVWRFGPDGATADEPLESFSYAHAERAAAPHVPEPVSDDAGRVQGFAGTLAAAVRARVQAAGRHGVAATLSGGLDSSLVAALLVRDRATPLPTYTLHFGEKLPNELVFARLVARHLGTEHHEVALEPRRFARDLTELAALLDDPIGDPVTLGNYAMARQIDPAHPVVFNGEGGDPCFGGPKTIPMMMHHWYGPGADTSPDPLHRERAYLMSYRRAYHELPQLLCEPYRGHGAHLPELLSPYFARPHSVLLRMLLEINQRLKGAHLILPKVERLQRSAGLWPMSPLFDRAMIDASMTLPARLIVARGSDKRVLREVAAPLLPPEILARPKSGMRVPVNYWFRGELRGLAKKLLAPKRVRRAGIFDAERVQEILRYDTEQSGARYGLWLWMLLTFEMWRGLVLEGEQDW